jgi:hypothetical protein
MNLSTRQRIVDNCVHFTWSFTGATAHDIAGQVDCIDECDRDWQEPPLDLNPHLKARRTFYARPKHPSA